jgi:hypothetical protein
MSGFTPACGFAGYSKLESANICWASGLVRNSISLIASARFFAWVVTPAPEMFTWVPVVCWLAQKAATGKAASLARMRPR